MIIGKLHPGSGLGNQLHTYVMTRVRACALSCEFSFVGKEFFKGNSLFQIDWGKDNDLTYHIEQPAGKLIVDSPHTLWEEKTEYYNPEINFVEDGTVIDGYFQDERYFEHMIPSIREWLKTEPLEMDDTLIVINFRGGEFKYVPELYLTEEYWDEALDLMIERMKKKYQTCRVEVHTDDSTAAVQMFPEFVVYQDLAYNWRSIRYAKHLILSNSSFAILPALLNENADIIAPRYFARRNTKTWWLPQNYYKRFLYI